MTQQQTTSLAIILPLITAVLTYFLTRQKTKAEERKINAEADGQEIENSKLLIDLWKGTVESLRSEVDSLSSDLKQYRQENAALRKELSQYRKENESLLGQIEQLKQKIGQLIQSK